MLDLSVDDITFNPISFKTQLRKLGDDKHGDGQKKVRAIRAAFYYRLEPQRWHCG
jgi:hypothetical protein